jgi:D-cysteine desulfhydrase family pyridoxal phosphate-dependent enzyme
MNARAAAALERQPRFRLARLPTPLDEAVRLRAALGGEKKCPRILLKRDDLTDLALGGNKARKLEFLVGDALHSGVTALITTGDVQSNHARMTAAAARMAGLRCTLVLSASNAHPEVQGNLLLDHLVGAEIHIVEAADAKAGVADTREAETIADVQAQLAQAGEHPRVIVLGGSDGVGALGYVAATLEMLEQLRARALTPTRLYYASGSRGTQAGLELGARVFSAPWRCMGVAVSPGEAEKRERATRIAADAAKRLDVVAAMTADELFTDQSHYGEGYAVPTHTGLEAIRLLVRTEGILLDPVYTAKGMAGLIHDVRSGAIGADETVIFLHTGGAAGLFGAAGRLAPLLADGA